MAETKLLLIRGLSSGYLNSTIIRGLKEISYAPLPINLLFILWLNTG